MSKLAVEPMKRVWNAPPNEEPPIEISPEADAAMRKLVELFSDPAMTARAHFRCSTERLTFCSSQSSMTSSAMSQTVNIKIG